MLFKIQLHYVAKAGLEFMVLLPLLLMLGL